MAPLTIFLGRFFGLACLLMCLGLLLKPKASLAAMAAMMESPGLLLVTGIVTLFGGVAAVVGHTVWTGGALPIAVTALAWVTLIKGFALVAVPAPTLAAFYRGVNYPRRFRLVMLVALAFSVWLTAAAFGVLGPQG